MIIGKGERRMCLGLAGVFRALSARGFDAGVPHVGVPDAGDTSSSDTTPATLLQRHYSSDSSPATFRTSDFCCRLLKGWLLHSCLVFDYNSHTYWRYSNILVNTHTKQRFVAPWACIYPHKNCPTQSDLFISKMEVVANKYVTMSHCFPQRD